MLSLLFAIYFAISPSEISECDRVALNSDETLYKEILLSSKDSKVKLKYLKKFGNCINTEGISLTDIRNIPVIEILDCKNPLKKSGSEIFFNNGKICSKSVQFFPSRDVFTITSSLPVVFTDEKWQSVVGKDTVLFSNKNGKFAQYQDSEGRVLSKNSEGMYTDQIGKSAHPFFVFESGTWKTAYPLRELFEVTVSKDNSFVIKMISESPIPYDRDKLIETTGLKAADIVVETPVPSYYFIKGSSLRGVRIPYLSMARKNDSFHGTYVFRLSYKGLVSKTNAEISETNYSIKIKSSPDFKELILTITSKKLNMEEITKNKAIINKEVPSFIITKGDAQK